jgi:spectinomycin phosphotransferase
MKAPPADLDTQEIVRALQTHWQLDVRQLEYLALGFGAHHWRAASASGAALFLALHELGQSGHITNDSNDSFTVVEQALNTVRWLETVAELDFAVSPLVDRSGACCQRVSDRFALSVYPWLDCDPMHDPDSQQTAELLARLHAVAPSLPPDLVRIEDFRIPHRAALEDALGDLGRAWHTGPYAEPARERLGHHRQGLHELLEFYDAEAGRAASSSPGWVVTHGEPFGPNLLQCSDGRLLLVDWDSVLLAPRERDLWEIPRDGPTGTTYRGLIEAPIDDRLLRLYRAWYDLAETAIYTSVFRSPHQGDENDVTSWENFLYFLPIPERWPDVVT